MSAAVSNAGGGRLNRLQEHALALIERGFVIQPAHRPEHESGGKRPIATAWQNAEPMEPADALAAWAGDHPPNISILTGARGGVFVIDVDGERGNASMRELLAGRPLPRTFMVKTASGGWHIYFRHPPQVHVPTNKSRLAPGLDLRGDGGQVIGPGSTARTKAGSLGAYEVVVEAPVANAPDWLLEACVATASVRSMAPEVAADNAIEFTSMSPDMQDAARAYVRSAVEGLQADLRATADWPIGHSDDWGRGWEKIQADAALRLASFAISSWAPIGMEEAREAFLAAAPTDDTWISRDVEKKWASQVPRAIAIPMPANLGQRGSIFEEAALAERPVESESATDDEFWLARPVLTHVRDYARSVRVGPYALLGGLLARVCAAVPPEVTLPPIVGGRASLNTYVLTVGSSGAGKGAAIAASEEAFTDLPEVTVEHPGSGEGLLKAYVHWERGKPAKDGDPAEPGKVIQHEYRLLAVVDEVDTLDALKNRSGSTIMGMLRSAWSGAALGFRYAADEKALKVGAHHYRLAMIVQGQPERCEPILADADGGTPQRFLWLPTDDPGAPEERPARVEPIALHLRIPPAARHEMRVPESIVKEIDAARVANLHGRPGDLDGHAGLVRLKAAALLALLDGRQHVNIDDWHLAGHLAAVSDHTRASVQAAIAARAARENLQRGRAEGRRRLAAEEEVDQARSKRVADRVMRYLASGGVARRALLRKFASSERDDADRVLAALVEAGQVVSSETERGERLSLPQGGKGGSDSPLPSDSTQRARR